MEDKLRALIERVHTETGLSLQVIRASYGCFDGEWEWNFEALGRSPTKGKSFRPNLYGVGPTPEVAANDLIDAYERWADPSIAEKESRDRLIAEILNEKDEP